ncbi:hypothetical protein FSCG_02161 [Fusobacterium vincentii 4_1_13]|uniref:Uncharacterized protein n=1 Tax=Fusobacterium vincentii 4_1_13 TaxID=469606 RepID=A0A0K9CM44_FUSVC|nr:hypothetical protein FSCG_02161 [Fusobacterium vincentii 4_1_13]
MRKKKDREILMNKETYFTLMWIIFFILGDYFFRNNIRVKLITKGILILILFLRIFKII